MTNAVEFVCQVCRRSVSITYAVNIENRILLAGKCDACNAKINLDIENLITILFTPPDKPEGGNGRD